MIQIDAKKMARIEQSRLETVLLAVVEQLRLQYIDPPSELELRSQLQPLVEKVHSWGISENGFFVLHIFACKVIGIDYYTLPGFEAVFSDAAISDRLKEEWLGGWLSKLLEVNKLELNKNEG